MDIVDCIMGIMYIVAFGCALYYINKFQMDKLKGDSKPKNKVHFYVARDKNGDLWLYFSKPFRDGNIFKAPVLACYIRLNNQDVFKYFGLNKDDYANLKWEDEPVEVFLNLDD